METIKTKSINFIIKQFNHILSEGVIAVKRKLKRLFLLPLELIMLIISIPFVIIIRLINPFLTVRLAMLDIARIGGVYKGNLYLSEKECGHHQGAYFDRFYFTKSTNHVNLQWKKCGSAN
tara:strand:+ start:1502 stop:1861 length:360 start_codon:yes stop_codon:yes gene_type:complete